MIGEGGSIPAPYVPASRRSKERRMARHILLAFSNPLEAREEEFNAWYDGRHHANGGPTRTRSEQWAG
jgi:hypothetical protein